MFWVVCVFVCESCHLCWLSLFNFDLLDGSICEEVKYWVWLLNSLDITLPQTCGFCELNHGCLSLCWGGLWIKPLCKHHRETIKTILHTLEYCLQQSSIILSLQNDHRADFMEQLRIEIANIPGNSSFSNFFCSACISSIAWAWSIKRVLRYIKCGMYKSVRRATWLVPFACTVFCLAVWWTPC